MRVFSLFAFARTFPLSIRLKDSTSLRTFSIIVLGRYLPVSRASQTVDVCPNSQGSLQTIYHVALILVDGIIHLVVGNGFSVLKHDLPTPDSVQNEL